MASRNPDPKLVARVLELVCSGCSASQVQVALGVPRSTVTRWVRAAEASRAPAQLSSDEIAACIATARAKTDEIAAAVEVLGDNWCFADVTELVGVSPNAIRAWLRARVDRVLARKGIPLDAVRGWLEFSDVPA